MKKLHNNKGLTLIEIIVSLALLGIIISPFMGFSITSQKINNESNREFKSIQLAQKYIEEIKAADTIDFTKYKDEDSDGIYERSLVEDDYLVDIEIKPIANNIVVDETTIVYDATLKIGGTGSFDTNHVYWNGIYNSVIISNKVDITIDDSKITLGTNIIGTTAEKIKVVFNNEATLNIINSSREVKLYIENNDNDWEINVNKGVAPIIFEQKEEKAGNILYSISVNVTKNGYVTSVEGTKIIK